MKKLILLLIFVFAALFIQAQSATVIPYKLSAVTVNGTGTGTTTFPIIAGEYDVSIQMIPATAGQGDSVIFSHVMYLSDSYSANAWTAVSSVDTVSSATDSDGIVWWADMKSLRIKAIYTGISTDTITIQPYVVYKKHANE
ncbi:MAG: hypothetical protein JRI77_16700 [Deltaproteobacteria bacterium]|nr:hypothetical protein [Deltaproteobacteria bacterium]